MNELCKPESFWEFSITVSLLLTMSKSMVFSVARFATE